MVDACLEGNATRVRQLAKVRGCNVAAMHGYTYLPVIAAHLGHVDVITALHELGADFF